MKVLKISRIIYLLDENLNIFHEKTGFVLEFYGNNIFILKNINKPSSIGSHSYYKY